MLENILKVLGFLALAFGLGYAIAQGLNLAERADCLKWQRYEAEYSLFELKQEDINYCYAEYGVQVKE